MNTGFSKEWEDDYIKRKNSKAMVSFPWSDVVSLVHRHCCDFFFQAPPSKILELGCGTGANIPLFLARGFDYVGIDGSLTAIKMVKEIYPKLLFVEQDFTNAIPFDNESFDLILDRGAITYAETRLLDNMFREIHRVLKKGGIFLSVDLFSKEHPSFLLSVNDKKIDESTVLNPSFGATKGLGVARFWDYDEITKYFKDFDILYTQHKKVDDMTKEQLHGYACFDVVAKKNK
jgi:SAM-dependent methyltransferase